MKYQSELIKEIVDTRGHEKSSIHYVSECIETWIEETKGSYPKLSDYQSEWLNYINENPIGNFPYETVTDVTEATVNNVVPYAYKSAILSGNTSYKVTQYSFLVGKHLNVSNGSLNVGTSYHLYCEDYFLIPKGTQITLRGNNNYKKICYYDVNKNFISGEGLSTDLLTDFTTVIPSNAKYFRFNTSKTNITSSMDDYLKIYIDDDLYLSNEEYIQEQELISVKMPVLKTTGKNLFNGELENGAIVSSTGANTPSTDNVRSVGYIKVKPNTSIVLSNNLNYSNHLIYEYDSNKNYIGRKMTNPFTTSTNCHYIRFRSDTNQPNLDVKYQIEYGTIATPYEPFKSNILTVNEDVTLRGIGDVHDELNVVTGELTQRIGEIVLDGNEKWATRNDLSTGETTAFYITVTNKKKGGLLVADKLKTIFQAGSDNIIGDNTIEDSRWGGGYFFIHKNISSINDFKTWLSQNNITVQYELAQEVVKTVDLTILDQDGNTLSIIKPIEGTMHIHSDGTPLKPSITMEIPVEATTQNLASFIKEE